MTKPTNIPARQSTNVGIPMARPSSVSVNPELLGLIVVVVFLVVVVVMVVVVVVEVQLPISEYSHL